MRTSGRAVEAAAFATLRQTKPPEKSDCFQLIGYPVDWEQQRKAAFARDGVGSDGGVKQNQSSGKWQNYSHVQQSSGLKQGAQRHVALSAHDADAGESSHKEAAVLTHSNRFRSCLHFSILQRTHPTLLV
ncbi:hypothetical protein CRG98_036304 [Punica granatum]|uniref:Uncharacterized protein n=1 Tax=Punica granatum TaxID=22663 RepID=A0A2I0IH58_PUNGR|nr:hypothetical protein CRG98_036304 [Punica granatum]